MVKFWCLAYLLTLPQIWHFGVFFHTSLSLFCLRAAAVSISYPSPANHLSITCQSVHCCFEQHSTNKWHLCVRVCVCSRVRRIAPTVEFCEAAWSWAWHHHPYFKSRLAVIKFSCPSERGWEPSSTPFIVLIKLAVFEGRAI